MLTSAVSYLRRRHAVPIIALLVSGGVLVGAWTFQYGFGYHPCTMCYWQRHAHKVVLGLAGLWLILRVLGVKAEALFQWILVIAFLISFGIAAWHVGVEFGVLEGPKACAGGNASVPAVDPNDPLAFLDGTIRPPACSEAVWHFLGLSMAGWNALISLMSALWIAISKTR